MNSSVQQSVLFVSMCPKCNLPQPQRGFSRATLEKLLTGNHSIEGYCFICDEFWSVSPHERAAIAEALAG